MPVTDKPLSWSSEQRAPVPQPTSRTVSPSEMNGSTPAALLTAGRDGIDIRFRNFWLADLAQADVVVCYLFPDVMGRLGTKLAAELAEGARVVSFNFPIPGWTARSTLRAPSRLHNDPIYIYRIPESLPGHAEGVRVRV